MADEQTPPPPRGRPRGSGPGETPIRHVRIGPLWDRARELDAQLATREGRTKTNVSAIVERALRREVDRMERELAKPN